jgi:hypothetical protein
MWKAYLQQLQTIAGLTLLGARYVRKNDLDGFFGAKANNNWKKMSDEGQLSELFHSENAIHTMVSFN